MKGLIVEKRAKQLIALCLVILQVCFQFPIQWKVEGVTQKNNEKELHFLFKDENGQASKGTNVLVKLSIYKEELNEEDIVPGSDPEVIEKNKSSSSNLNISSPSILEKEKTSSSNSKKEVRTYPAEEDISNKFTDDAVSPGDHNPQYNAKLETVLYFTGTTGLEGEIAQTIPSQYLKKDYIIEIRVRAYNDTYESKEEKYLIRNGIPEVGNFGDLIDISIDQKKKQTWKGELKFEYISNPLFGTEKTCNLEVKATYKATEDEERRGEITAIEYELHTPNNQKVDMGILGTATLYSTGKYIVVARVPKDENHDALEISREILASKKFLQGFLENDETKAYVPFVANQPIVLPKNPSIQGDVRFEYADPNYPNNYAITISSDKKTLFMKAAKTVSIKVTVSPWVSVVGSEKVYYDGFSRDILVNIGRGPQTGFRFSPSKFQKRIVQEGDDTVYEYEIPYGLKNINESGDHKFLLATEGQLGNAKVVYKLEDGEEIADLDPRRGVLNFKDGKIGTVKVSATAQASDDGNYESRKIVAKINISYTDNSAMLEKRGIKSAKGWYQKVIYTAGRYKLSLSDSWKSSNNWVDRLEFTEDSPSTEGKEIFLMDPKTGEISSGLKPGVKLKKYNIDGTPPQLSSIVDSKNKETKIKSIREYDFYKDPLEIQLKA